MLLTPGRKALANPTRLRVLELLKDPSAFDGPRDSDGRALGVTASGLLKHQRIRQPSLNEQMAVLIGIGLVEARRVGRWVVYTRTDERYAAPLTASLNWAIENGFARNPTYPRTSTACASGDSANPDINI